MKVEIYIEDMTELAIVNNAMMKLIDHRRRSFTSEPIEEPAVMGAGAGLPPVPTAPEPTQTEAPRTAEQEQPAPAPDKTYDPSPVEITAGDVADATRALITRKGVDVAVRVLSAFNVKRAGELEASQYAPYMDAVSRELGA